MMTRRREFMGSLAAGLLRPRLAGAQAQGGQERSGSPSANAAPLPIRKAKTRTLFKSPEAERQGAQMEQVVDLLLLRLRVGHQFQALRQPPIQLCALMALLRVSHQNAR